MVMKTFPQGTILIRSINIVGFEPTVGSIISIRDNTGLLLQGDGVWR